MKKVFLLTVTAMFLLITSEMNQLCAQPEFATVRLVTLWGKSSTIFISIGNNTLEEIELGQKHCDKRQRNEYQLDNVVLNEKFSNLYGNGFKIVSTASTQYMNAGREVLYLLVKE
jgi:hypothetical protein